MDWLTVTALFAEGILSFLSPCVLPILPVYVGILAGGAGEKEESRTVYVARHGTADVYWYDINSMPSNTNKANVVTMTEADAIAQGKRHTTKE